MEEFIFGTLATDELKLVHHRAARRGLQHAHRIIPRDPLPGQPVTLIVTVGPDLPAEHVACYYTLDGSEPAGDRGRASNGQVLMLEPAGVEWDTFMWNYVARWQGILPTQPEGTAVRYRISAGAGEGPETWADWPEVQATAEQAASAFFRNQPVPEIHPGNPRKGETFAYRVDRYRPPEWARQAVIYQIFVDRFFPGRGRDWLQTEDLNGICGGTLWGAAEKLDYLADLGVDCVWLSPTFSSPSHHGYDATDLKAVEPRLGGDEALHYFIDEAHARGIRVLLDLVCNHISQYHPIFQGAKSDPHSRYRHWFTFDDSEVGYRAFFGAANMPQLNLAHPAARDWLLDIARYWLREFDADGYRLDYAIGPGLAFWTDFWATCKDQKPDSFCFGETVDAPNELIKYVGRLDGCLDFNTGDALRRTYALNQWDKVKLDRFLQQHYAFFPADFLMPTFIDNHDMDRFLFLAGGDKEALRRAAAAQMRLPGPPIIYYGTEVGLSQAVSTRNHGLHLCRTPMVWGDELDRDLLAYYQSLIQQRKNRYHAG